MARAEVRAGLTGSQAAESAPESATEHGTPNDSLTLSPRTPKEASPHADMHISTPQIHMPRTAAVGQARSQGAPRMDTPYASVYKPSDGAARSLYRHRL